MDENSAARFQKRLSNWTLTSLLFAAMTIICLPGLWIVLNSFRPAVEIMAKPPIWIPQELPFEAYRKYRSTAAPP